MFFFNFKERSSGHLKFIDSKFLYHLPFPEEIKNHIAVFGDTWPMTTITTHWGTWRRFAYPNRKYFAEFKSNATFWGLPLLHYTRGKCPETGRQVVTKGIIAVGRLAMGVLAIGQTSFGLMAIGQAGARSASGLRTGSHWALCHRSSCNRFYVWSGTDRHWTDCFR